MPPSSAADGHRHATGAHTNQARTTLSAPLIGRGLLASPHGSVIRARVALRGSRFAEAQPALLPLYLVPKVVTNESPAFRSRDAKERE